MLKFSAERVIFCCMQFFTFQLANEIQTARALFCVHRFGGFESMQKLKKLRSAHLLSRRVARHTLSECILTRTSNLLLLLTLYMCPIMQKKEGAILDELT